MANKVPDNIEFAGDYDLKNIFLHNHFGEVIDIKKLVQEMNIYESILCHSVLVTFSPVSFRVNVSEVAKENRAKAPPFSKCLISGSFPRLPTNITLFTLAI